MIKKKDIPCQQWLKESSSGYTNSGKSRPQTKTRLPGKVNDILW